jgi:hypothetical protein
MKFAEPFKACPSSNIIHKSSCYIAQHGLRNQYKEQEQELSVALINASSCLVWNHAEQAQSVDRIQVSLFSEGLNEAIFISAIYIPCQTGLLFPPRSVAVSVAPVCGW